MFDMEIPDNVIQDKFAKLQQHTANVRNLEMLMEKQLQTTKALADSNRNFKDTTRSIFSQNHHYFNESCRIVDVHGQVTQMYMHFIQELEQSVGMVRTWSNKFRICDDRKKIRDKSLNDFNKAFV